MKKCTQCSAENVDDAMVCQDCGHAFAPSVSADPALTPFSSRSRPDGTALLIGGWLLIGLAIFLFLVGFSQASRYGGGFAALNAAADMSVALTVGASFFKLGLVLALAGHVVRALWFLPGPAHKSA